MHLMSLKIMLEVAFRYFHLVSRALPCARETNPLRIRIGASDLYLLKDQLQQNIMIQGSKVIA